MPRVLCVTGMPGCGKEELLKVAESLGLPVLRMGDVVREEARRRSLPFTDAEVGGMADGERKQHGLGIWAKRTIPHVTAKTTLVDGIRGTAEVEAFREAWPGQVAVIAVEAPPDVRYERVKNRARPDDSPTFEAFLERDRRELSWGLGDIIATADHHLHNEGTLEDFQRQARGLLTKLLGA
jgi:dephospho-CoA kinase